MFQSSQALRVADAGMREAKRLPDDDPATRGFREEIGAGATVFETIGDDIFVYAFERWRVFRQGDEEFPENHPIVPPAFVRPDDLGEWLRTAGNIAKIGYLEGVVQGRAEIEGKIQDAAAMFFSNTIGAAVAAALAKAKEV